MFKRILLPLDGSEDCNAATRQACDIALAHGAEITGLVVLNTPEILDKERLPFNAHLRDLKRKAYFEMKKEAQAHIDKILRKFSETCELRGVAHREAELQGLPANCILDESIYYDLLVIGVRTHFHLDPSEEGDSMEKILTHASVPLLAVPKEDPIRPMKTVLVAFNASYHSVRALRELAKFAQPFPLQVKILVSDEDDEYEDHCMSEAVEYVKSYGAKSIEMIRTEENILTAVDEYLDSVDLFVAGIHSKNMFKSFFVGSFTRKLIEQAKVPLLLA